MEAFFFQSSSLLLLIKKSRHVLGHYTFEPNVYISHRQRQRVPEQRGLCFVSGPVVATAASAAVYFACGAQKPPVVAGPLRESATKKERRLRELLGRLQIRLCLAP